MANQTYINGLLIYVFVLIAEARHTVKESFGKVLQSDNTKARNSHKVILTGNKQSFEEAVRAMDASLQQNDVPCTVYDPVRPDFLVQGHRVSEIKCLQHIWEIKKEDDTQRRVDQCQAMYAKEFSGIVGGRKSTPGEFPHMGAIGWKDIPNKKYVFKCGSFLISNRFVLTAAHCYYDENGKHPKIVRFGVNNIADEKANPDQPIVDIRILKFIKHPKYRPEPFKTFDIAAIELAERVTFNEYIQPVCILSQEVNQAIITGWGKTNEDEDDELIDELQVAEVDVLPNKVCKEKWRPKTGNKYWKKFLNSQMCATKMEGVADICGGDSGGPLQVKLQGNTNRSIYNVVGITSLNDNCGSHNFPSVFTKVSSYLNWIEEIVWGVQTEHSEAIIEDFNSKTQQKPLDKPEKENEVRINDVQDFDNGLLFWYDSLKRNQWVYIDKNEFNNQFGHQSQEEH